MHALLRHSKIPEANPYSLAIPLLQSPSPRLIACGAYIATFSLPHPPYKANLSAAHARYIPSTPTTNTSSAPSDLYEREPARNAMINIHPRVRSANILSSDSTKK